MFGGGASGASCRGGYKLHPSLADQVNFSWEREVEKSLAACATLWRHPKAPYWELAVLQRMMCTARQ
eukprot:2431178-Pyramimonas_sp.AAC.2